MVSNGGSLNFYGFNSNGSYTINDILANGETDGQSLHIGSDNTTNMNNINDNWYGSYLGPNNPYSYEKKETYSYAVPPIDDLDYAAYQHDKGYDKYGAVGITGVLFNNKVWKEDALLALRSAYIYNQSPAYLTNKRAWAFATYMLFAPSSSNKYKKIKNK